MSRLACILTAALLVVAPATGGATGPVLPAMGDSASRSLSTDMEAAIGRQIVRDLRAAGMIIDDPQATEYLQAMGQRLASRSSTPDQRFTFFLVDSDDINAFALPGGYIGIHAGLLMATQNESELASVVAHEIAHVTQRHIARQVEQASRMSLVAAAGMLAAVLVGVTTGHTGLAEAGMAAGPAAMMQSRINFTRAHEHEADRIGISMLADAGFDPKAMATLFGEFERRARGSASRIPDFLRTHPVTSQRIAEARERAGAYTDVEVDESRVYPLMRARARALATSGSDAENWFRQELRRAPPAERDALSYGLALVLIDHGKYDEARALLAPLRDADDDVVYYHIALARAEFNAGDTDAAMATYDRAMRMFPRSVAVTQAYAQALLHSGRGREAHTHLVGLLPLSRPNPNYFRLLAMSSGSAGELADAHYFMSEVHILNGQLMPAIDQLQLALAIPGINRQQRTRAEARLEQLAEFLPRSRRGRLDEPLVEPRFPDP